MTFSVIARCKRTDMFGIAIATRPLAIGAKCPFLKAGIGGLVSQANGDPRFGPLGLNLLELGYSAPKVMKEIEDNDPYIEWRQIAVVDRDGRTAARTGTDNEDYKGHIAIDNFVSLGNRVTSEATISKMADKWETTDELDLGERLMRCLEAGRDAGGQIAGQHSAAILVMNKRSYGWIDLRADEHDEPIGELRRILDLYTPLLEYYDVRPAKPDMPRDDIWRKERGV